MRLAALCGGAAAALAWSATPAGAAQAAPGGFTVAPLKVQVDVDPGQSATGTIRVFTRTPGEAYRIEVGDVSQNDDGSYNYNEPSGKPEDVSSWLEVRPGSFTSGPGATEPVAWTVRVPTEADPGEHLGAVYVTQVATPRAGQVTLQARIAVRMEFTVRGDIVFRPHLERVSVPRFSSEGPIPIKLVLANDGNVRVDLRKATAARIDVFDGSKVVATFSLVPTDPETPVVLFPNAVRTFEFAWKDPPTFGRFTARATIGFPDDDPLRRSAPFTVVPYRQVGGIAVIGLGALLVVGYLLAGRVRRRRGAGPPAR